MARKTPRSTPFSLAPGHPISYFPSLVPVAGSVKAAVLLCQLVYWTPRTKDHDGWIYKTQGQLMQETGMTRHELQQARAALKHRRLLTDRYGRQDHRLWLRVDVQNYNAAIAMISDDEPAEAHPESGHATSGKRTCHIRKADMAHPETGFRSSTEILTETTAETTTTPLPPTSEDMMPSAPMSASVVEVAETVALAQGEETKDTATDGSIASAGVRPFAAFYAAYGSPRNRRQAQDKWDRQHLDTSLPLILQALSWQRTLTGHDALVKCPHIYLENQGWTQTPPAAVRHASTSAPDVLPSAAPSTCRHDEGPLAWQKCAAPVGDISNAYCDTHARANIVDEVRQLQEMSLPHA